jgi:predicted AlkP superfamily phosphohydrolase/phosphomutase
VELYAARSSGKRLISFRPGEWTQWVEHTFMADGQPVRAGLRGKLLKLSPDASEVHLYLSEIYPLDDFVNPSGLAPELVERCGPFIIQCSRQQVVQGGASDIATYFDEQQYLAYWWRNAAEYILGNHDWDLFMLKWHGPDWTNHLTMYMIDPRHPMYQADRAEEGWAMWDRLMGWGDEIIARAMEAAGPDTLVALVSDHGGDTMLPGLSGHNDLNRVLREGSWLVNREGGGIDWSRSKAFGTGHYVYLNVKDRDPDGIVEQGDEYLSLRDEIMEALLTATDASGRHLYRVVLPMEDAGRLAVGGDRVGDIFMIPSKPHPLATVSREEFWKTHTEEQTGTWDWPRLNAGSHSDDSYFVLSGPGVKKGFRRQRPTLITSVAPTLAAAWGIPAPAHADGSVLWEFME